MKPLLIGLNILLLGALIFALAGHFDDELPEMTVATAGPTVENASRSGSSGRNALSAENIRGIISSSTAFSSASGASYSRNGQTVQLVGTIIAGDNSGAILLIRSGGRRNNWPPGAPQNNNGNNNAQTVADYSFKQYVKLGETNADGYKLVSLTADKAILTRGGERLELELQPASTNAPAATTANNNRNNQNRFFNNRDALAMQMMQNMQMMQIMNRLVQNQQQRATGSSSGRRTSSGGSQGGNAGFGGGGFGGGGFGGGSR